MKIIIYFYSMPEGIFGAAVNYTEDPDTYYLVCDTKTTVQKRRKTFGHELTHILNGHFKTEDTIKGFGEGLNVKMYEHGKLIPRDDTTTRLDRDTHSEKDAQKEAWSFYRRFRDQFIQAEKTGHAVIVI